MDNKYYSEETVKQFILSDVCQKDTLLFRYYENNDVKKFRKRFKSLKIEPKAVQRIVHVFVTDQVRSLITELISKLSKIMKPMGDFVITGGEAFNYYYTQDKRIVTNDIDTKFIPMFKSIRNKIISPACPYFFGYLQIAKVILWDAMGKLCLEIEDKIRSKFSEIIPTKFQKFFGVSLPSKNPLITKRYTVMRKHKQSTNNLNKVTEGDVLIDVELFAFDMNIRYFDFENQKIDSHRLGGLLDIAIMRPTEIGYEVIYSAESVRRFGHNVLMAGKQFLIEDVYLMQSLKLRPGKKEKDKKRLITFSKTVLKFDDINSKDSLDTIFKVLRGKLKKSHKNNKSVFLKRPAFLLSKHIEKVKKININQHVDHVTPQFVGKIASQFLIGARGPRNINVPGFQKTSGIFKFDLNSLRWKRVINPYYIKNEYNFRPLKKTTENIRKINTFTSPKVTLYGYKTERDKWMPVYLLYKASMIPLIGLKSTPSNK
tara:strand:- start:1379 stop:2833 length:1455 start_codon:yes stop_codon:yes gene_type:complete